MTNPTTITNNNPPTTPSCCLNQPSNCRVESETPHLTPTSLTPRPRFGRLDLDRHLTVGFAHVNHAHTIKAEHRLGQATTVTHRRDLLVVAVVEQPQR